jgi:hypothetical protein
MQRAYTGVVGFSFDGLIHNSAKMQAEWRALKLSAPNNRFTPESKFFCSGSPPDDSICIYVTNENFLKITLTILTQNHILCVLVSPREGIQKDNMFHVLNVIFGKQRDFLQFQHAEIINKSQQPFIQAVHHIPGCENIEAHQVLFLDHEQADANNDYLFATLTRLVRLPNIYAGIERCEVSEAAKKAFRLELLQFQLDHFQQAFTAQQLLQGIVVPEIRSQEALAKWILMGIQALIMETKWDIFLGGYKGFGAGKPVYLINAEYINNLVPPKMDKMLMLIQKANQRKKTWKQALEEVRAIAQKGEKPTLVSGFYRGGTTQLFYTKVAHIKETQAVPGVRL